MKPLLGALLLMSSAAFAASSVHEFTMDAINGTPTPLANFKGKVLLVVNVASQCGYTYQYEGLQALYMKYKDQGLVVAGFPANNFGAQEPGSNAEIGAFCKSKFGVTFPMFSKISVKGEDQHPLYSFLTNKESDPEFAGDITWNFNKFLVDKKGNIVARFSSKDTPESDTVTAAIEKYLAAK